MKPCLSILLILILAITITLEPYTYKPWTRDGSFWASLSVMQPTYTSSFFPPSVSFGSGFAAMPAREADLRMHVRWRWLEP